MALGRPAELVRTSDTEMATVGLPMVFHVHRADGSMLPVEVGARPTSTTAGEASSACGSATTSATRPLHDYLELLASVARTSTACCRPAVRLADATLLGCDDRHRPARRRGCACAPRVGQRILAPAVLEAFGAAERTRGCRGAAPGTASTTSSRCDDCPMPARVRALAAGFGSCWAEPLTIVDDAEPCASLRHLPAVGPPAR